MTVLTGKSLLDPDCHRACLDRIEKLTPENRPLWGTMTVAQMLSHCAEIQEVSNGKALRNTPFLARLFKGMIRNMVVNQKPYPRNTRTHPQYRQTGDREFQKEKSRLLAALGRFVEMEPAELDRVVHPLFGKMSRKEKGWVAFKHLDHHLNQFGV